MTVDAVTPTAILRKVEIWLTEGDTQMAIALKARPAWAGDAAVTVSGIPVRIVPCVTPLAIRAALHSRQPDERMVLLTELDDLALGDGLLAHLSMGTVRSVKAWDLVRKMFDGAELDPTMTLERFGGGKWIADALTEYAPQGRWPHPLGNVVAREQVLRSLTGSLLDLDGEDLDSATLLQWTLQPHAQLRFRELPAAIVDGVTSFLAEVAGEAATLIMHAVQAGHGIDAISLGLLMAPLWASKNPTTDVAIARTRLEPMFGGVRPTLGQAVAFQTAAEAWVDRALDSDGTNEVHRVFMRAETIAAEIGALPLLASSDLLPKGFDQRLRSFADALRGALSAHGVNETDLAGVHRALHVIDTHRAPQPHRVKTAQMATRLLRWLAAPDAKAPRTLYEALLRQVRDDAWVDRARLDVFAGDIDPDVADAYRRLYRAIDVRRARHDEEFAKLLAEDTSADAGAGAMLRVEDVLEKVVRPILTHGRRVLLLVLDGMSVAAATELAESLTGAAWAELTPGGGPRVGVLAALPTVTEVSRASLLSGRIATGGQATELAAFAELFSGGKLLHKAALRGAAGAALDEEVLAAVSDSYVPIVAAVINTIDDSLDSSDPGTIVWDQTNITPVRDLLALAGDRVVVIVSDHGHVVDRGPDGITRASTSPTNRWRPGSAPVGDGEIEIYGARVGLGDGRVVLPWREEIRYASRKAGYHGGASPAEAVIPLIVLARDENAVPDWSGAPVASPGWWREPLSIGAPETPRSATTGRKPAKQRQHDPGEGLFDLPTAAGSANSTPSSGMGNTGPVSAHRLIAANPARPAIIDALLASEAYRQRKDSRAALSDERVTALLTTLLAAGGRASHETLAANASVPAHRIAGIITALRKLLQVEGYPVLTLDPDGQTIKLDIDLLIEQFHLGIS